MFFLLWIHLTKNASLVLPLRCDGKRECHLEATKGFFHKNHDPCSGTRKYFKVEYGAGASEHASSKLGKNKALAIGQQEYMECARRREERRPLFAKIGVTNCRI